MRFIKLNWERGRGGRKPYREMAVVLEGKRKLNLSKLIIAGGRACRENFSYSQGEGTVAKSSEHNEEWCGTRLGKKKASNSSQGVFSLGCQVGGGGF